MQIIFTPNPHQKSFYVQAPIPASVNERAQIVQSDTWPSNLARSRRTRKQLDEAQTKGTTIRSRSYRAGSLPPREPYARDPAAAPRSNALLLRFRVIERALFYLHPPAYKFPRFPSATPARTFSSYPHAATKKCQGSDKVARNASEHNANEAWANRSRGSRGTCAGCAAGQHGSCTAAPAPAETVEWRRRRSFPRKYSRGRPATAPPPLAYRRPRECIVSNAHRRFTMGTLAWKKSTA